MAEVQSIEIPFLTKINVRLPAGGAAASAAGEVLGAPLPVEPNTVASGGAHHVLWLGPDEWLVVAPPADRRLEDELRAALGTESGALVDVSGERTILDLSGPRARDVLMKGCSIDLHPTAFQVGRCAQTGLARAQVVLMPTRQDAYWIFVRSSFSDYLSAWLRDAMAEYL